MHTFADTQGRTWTVTINVDVIRRVRSLLSINLLEAIEGRLLERLITDPVLLCDILFVVIQPEAVAKGISDEDFGRSLGGDVLDGNSTFVACDFSRQNACTDTGRMYPSSVSFP